MPQRRLPGALRGKGPGRPGPGLPGIPPDRWPTPALMLRRAQHEDFTRL